MDMLLALYRPLAQPEPAAGLILRKPIGPERIAVSRWVAARFNETWATEAAAACGNRPASIFVVHRGDDLLGFCCYDATARGYVGPIGVLESARGKGLGAALLLACLHDMRTMGYGYAIAGWVGEPEFFRKVAGATEIPDSTPGLYANMLR